MSEFQPFQVRRYLLMTVDPLHIGTGASRLGRVDNSIVREPGTRLPKIPGTGMSGAVRQYAAYRYAKIDCAGQKGHCGKKTCPICYTFGTANDQGGGYSGVLSVGDARILLFPVYSTLGPVWVTCPSVLSDALKLTVSCQGSNVLVGNDLATAQQVNLGWLMVSVTGKAPELTGAAAIPQQILKRIVVVSDKLFSQVVNSNLEVRTSVSIDPHTGAAEDKALFTYEAMPRATYLWFDLVEDDFRDRELWAEGGIKNKAYRDKETWSDNDPRGGPLGVTWVSAADVFESGLAWAEQLGIGGMGTRGFGRVRKIGEVSA